MSIQISGSYVQADKHNSVTKRYNPIQASQVGEVMAANGLTLTSLKTGIARHADKLDFQRTFARYRGPEIAPGLYLDIIHDSKKMGRGVDKLLVGIYRLICTNGLVVGSNFFEHKIRHAGNTKSSLDQGIKSALATTERLSKLILNMQTVQLNPSQVAEFESYALKLVVPENAQNVQSNLLKIRRDADRGGDLWSVFNVIQENIMRGNVAWSTNSSGPNPYNFVVRYHTARQVKVNTNRDREINQALFNIAMKFIK